MSEPPTIPPASERIQRDLQRACDTLNAIHTNGAPREIYFLTVALTSLTRAVRTLVQEVTYPVRLDEMQFPGSQSEDERMAAPLQSLPDFSITLEGTIGGPVDLEILKPAPEPRKCEAWINVQSLYDSPGAAAVPPHRLYCEVPAGERHSVFVEDPTAPEPVSCVVHRAKSIWWRARSVPEDDDV